jgi:hypothetical protein
LNSAVDVGDKGKGRPDEDNDANELSASKIWGDDDDEPPPKKISSTERLRALAKLNPDPNMPWPPFNEDEFANISADRDSLLKARGPPVSPLSRDAKVRDILGTPNPSWKGHRPNDEDEEDSSDGEFLSIAKPKSFANKKPVGLPPKSGSAGLVGKGGRSMEASTGEPTKEGEEGSSLTGPLQASKELPTTDSKQQSARPQPAEDDDDIFGFDAEDGLAKEMSAAPPYDHKDSDDESGVALPEPDELVLVQTTSSSAARSIPQPDLETMQAGATTPTTPQSAKVPTAPIVGSYKGKPITMPVVVDPDVQQQAASLGDFNSFVGGLDGRSGMDEADPSSFRASISKASGFSGTPRSFSERLMMEEVEERRKGQDEGEES